MATLRVSADLIVQDAAGGLVALVEVKNREELSAQAAASIRRNLIMHGLIGLLSPYFLIVSQDHGYLWNQRSGQALHESLPTVQFPMGPVVARYLPSLATGVRLTGSQLELAVAQWLSDLASGEDEPLIEIRNALDQVGFLAMIRGGRVGSQVEI